MHEQLGAVYQQMGQRDNDNHKLAQAVEQFQLALRLNPGSAAALFGLGMTYRLMSNRERAQVFLKRFVETAGSNVPSHYRDAARQVLSEMQESPQL